MKQKIRTRNEEQKYFTTLPLKYGRPYGTPRFLLLCEGLRRNRAWPGEKVNISPGDILNRRYNVTPVKAFKRITKK